MLGQVCGRWANIRPSLCQFVGYPAKSVVDKTYVMLSNSVFNIEPALMQRPLFAGYPPKTLLHK